MSESNASAENAGTSTAVAPSAPTIEQRLAKALSTNQARSLTMLSNKLSKPRVARAKLEAALEGMVKGGAVALIPPPPLAEGAKRGRGRPAVAKYLNLIPAPVATQPVSDAPSTAQ